MIEHITASNFRRYGKVIEYPRKSKKGTVRNLFRIVLADDRARGWRIAYLIVRDRKIRRLESHPFSFESFEPVSGRALLYVAVKKDLTTLKCFRLNKPVILKKGIWHGVVTVTEETEIKLAENAQVRCVYWPLKAPLTCRF